MNLFLYWKDKHYQNYILKLFAILNNYQIFKTPLAGCFWTREFIHIAWIDFSTDSAVSV